MCPQLQVTVGRFIVVGYKFAIRPKLQVREKCFHETIDRFTYCTAQNFGRTKL